MKRLFLPIALISFAVICLGIVHIDNVNKLDAESTKLREKHQSHFELKKKDTNNTESTPETK
ncbi:hypothetical protein [Aquimarina sp. 2201CG5-10]|uniref:hypothetical protein n=1 Tax=Aquimarina callyspongiae TaxID=3098150 RepID=UPI002AB5CA51|nr:hypothetical protein [Aquimarina sp. 2201CG5-10]MDY8135793.1 hypothetical protein [Aquimarina sp. 2201CG5-10]